MGYFTVTQRVFVRVPHNGADYFIPLVFGGDSNTYMYTASRRVKQCCSRVMGPVEMIGAYEALLIKMARESSGGFYYGNKWIDETNVEKWYKDGIKGAHTIEEYRVTNPLRYIQGIICVGEQEGEPPITPESMIMSTTEELAQWIEKIKEFRWRYPNLTGVAYVLEFTGDYLLRRVDRKIEEPVVACSTKGRRQYVMKSELVHNEYGITLTSDINEAQVYSSVEEGRKILGNEWNVNFIRLSAAAIPKNYAVTFDGEWSGHFILKLTAKSMKFTIHAEGGIRFESENAAIRYIEKCKKKYPPNRVGNYRVYNILTGEIKEV